MMKRLLLLLSAFIFFGSIAQAQKKSAKKPAEIYIIGNLKLYKVALEDYAAVYDPRVDILFEFALPNGNECGQLVENKHYIFRLLATCIDPKCYEAKYELLAFALSPKQNYRDVHLIKIDTEVTKQTADKPRVKK